MLEMDRMANQMLSSASFPLPRSLMPQRNEDDDFFKDLPSTSSNKNAPPESQESKSTEHPGRAYSSYSFSSSTIFDERGHRFSTVRRRYEDSSGRLKAMHEREIDDKKMRDIWDRKRRDDEGEHSSMCTADSAEAFEKEWKKNPFGEAEAVSRLSDQQTQSHDSTRAVKDYAFGADHDAANKAPGKHLGEEAHGVTEEAQRMSRKEAIAQKARRQEEETTLPNYN